MYNFTKLKFLDFPLRQQHKKCAELLRQVYDLKLKGHSIQEGIDHYNEIQSWMTLPALIALDFKSLADKYHEHLEVAHVNIRENNLLPHVKTGDRGYSEPYLPIAIYLDRIRSAFNVGSILRTAEAMALGTVYFGGNTPFIDNRQVQNTSMDAHRWLPCVQNAKLEELPRPIIVMETSTDAISIHDFVFPEKFTLVVGNEEYGCSDHALKLADYVLEIPLQGRKNSLNVANAFSIVATEIRRQKNINPQDKTSHGK